MRPQSQAPDHNYEVRPPFAAPLRAILRGFLACLRILSDGIPAQDSLMCNLSRLALSLSIPTLMLLLAAISLARSPAAGTGGPVYTVAALQERLARQPSAWIDRTVRVHAVAEPCTVTADGPGAPCVERHPALVDVGKSDAALPLLAGQGPRYALLALARRIPLLRRLMPAPASISWGVAAVYRIELRRSACSGGAPPCYAALLLAAAPQARWAALLP
jgi:hypothetical protein